MFLERINDSAGFGQHVASTAKVQNKITWPFGPLMSGTSSEPAWLLPSACLMSRQTVHKHHTIQVQVWTGKSIAKLRTQPWNVHKLGRYTKISVHHCKSQDTTFGTSAGSPRCTTSFTNDCGTRCAGQESARDRRSDLETDCLTSRLIVWQGNRQSHLESDYPDQCRANP